MKGLKNFGLVMVMALVLGIGAGCTKKSTEVPTGQSVVTDTGASAVDVAAQTITDGVVYFDFDKYDVKPEYREMLRQMQV